MQGQVSNLPPGIVEVVKKSNPPPTPIRVKLSDWVGWQGQTCLRVPHGQALFISALLATHNGIKSTRNVADQCPPLAGV